MLVAERYAKIIQLVNDRGSIRVSELSELCRVTEETIRRDLDRLEQSGKLQRSHGGAVSVKDTQNDIPYFEREVMNAAEKKRIAAEAVARIEPYDKIVLDASTTASYMAAALPDIPLKVLTNSIKVALELAGKEKIEVISTGGMLSHRSLSYQGPLAESNLGQYHVDKAFISGKGIHPERGVSESNELQASMKRMMLGIADEVYLLADYSKFGMRAFSHIADCGQIHYLITDDKADGEAIRLLSAGGMNITISR